MGDVYRDCIWGKGYGVLRMCIGVYMGIVYRDMGIPQFHF